MYTVKEGDLLFYHSSGTWDERLVVAATCDGDPRADFVHVAIVDHVSDDGRTGTIIEARWRGIVKSPLPDLTSNRIVVYPLAVASDNMLALALVLARRKIGWSYGISDIISQGLRLLRLPFTVGRLHSLDCSHLAAEFATWASQDATLYRMVCDEGCDISPNSLARYYGLVGGKVGQEKAGCAMTESQEDVIRLSERDATALLEALDNPKPPLPKLVEAAERYKEFIKESMGMTAWNNEAFAQPSNACTSELSGEDLRRMVEALHEAPHYVDMPANVVLITPDMHNKIRWWRFGDARQRARLSTQVRRGTKRP